MVVELRSPQVLYLAFRVKVITYLPCSFSQTIKDQSSLSSSDPRFRCVRHRATFTGLKVHEQEDSGSRK